MWKCCECVRIIFGAVIVVANHRFAKSKSFSLVIARRDKRKILVIARRLSITKTTKQSTNATCESNVNCLLWANLCEILKNNNLLIHFWVIDFICLLSSCDLDCFALLSQGLAMTKYGFNFATLCETKD